MLPTCSDQSSLFMCCFFVHTLICAIVDQRCNQRADSVKLGTGIYGKLSVCAPLLHDIWNPLVRVFKMLAIQVGMYNICLDL